MAALRAAVLSVLLALVLVIAPSAGAIVGGTADTRASHNYVVFVGQLSAPRNACTGILVNSTTVITAAHCGLLLNGTAPVQPFVVFRGPNFRTPLQASPGTFYAHPDFAWAAGSGLPEFAENDLAVVKLAAPLPGPYATLPRLGAVDALDASTRGEIVGYGVQELSTGRTPIVNPTTGQVVDISEGRTPLRTNGSRMRGSAKLAGGGTVADSYVKVVSDACLGDSGGPVIVDGVSIAVLSFTPSACNAVTYATRLDTEAARRFLSDPRFGIQLP